MKKVAINGLGRIGRCIFRYIFESENTDLSLGAINSPADIKTIQHLLQYDTVHGKFKYDIEIDGDYLIVNGCKILVYQERNPENIAWSGIDLVFESTGKFKTYDEAQKHLGKDVRYVVISAPVSDTKIPTIVLGANDRLLPKLKSDNKIFSIGSCTTNCLAPVIKLVNDKWGVESAFVTTVHAVTGDQNIVDNSHNDLCRARAAHSSIVPTKTGAAKAISLVLPELSGKLDGTALRVPIDNVSMIDVSCIVSQEITVEEVNDYMIQVANNSEQYNNIPSVFGVNQLPLVSIDFNHTIYSSIFDTTATKVVGKNLLRFVSWYDNEWGFSARMTDTASLLLA